jgi:hypothetical protein
MPFHLLCYTEQKTCKFMISTLGVTKGEEAILLTPVSF